MSTIEFMGILLTNGDSFTYGDELPGSRTYGDDNQPNPFYKNTHQHRTYTHKLANHLGVNYVNLAQNGSSNQKIFRRTTSFLQKTNKEIDYMVIMWSSWGRLEVVSPITYKKDDEMFIQHDCNAVQFIPDHRQSELRFNLNNWPEGEDVAQAAIDWYSKVYTMMTPILHHLNYMCTLQQMADLMGIKIIQSIIHHGNWMNVLGCINKARNDDRFKPWLVEVERCLKYLRPECKLGFGDRLDMTSIAESPEHDDFFIYPHGHPCEGTHTWYAEMLYNKFKGMEE
jgi:hypothetical protein